MALLAALLCVQACAETPKRFDPEKDRVRVEARDIGGKRAYKFHGGTLSLAEALSLAARHNPELQAMASKVDIAAARIIQARLWPNPSLNISEEEGPLDDGAGFNDGKITAGFSQTLPLTGIVGARTRAAERVRELALANYELALRKLTGSVKKAFYRVLLARRFVVISQSNLGLARQLQQRANERVKSGAAPDTEKFRAEIEVAQSDVASRGARAAFEAAKRDLYVLVANPDLDVKVFVGEVPERVHVLNKARLEATVLSTHPALLVVGAAIDSAEAALFVSKKAWLPQPQLSVAIGRRKEDREVDTVFEWGLSIPIPFLNRNQGSIAASESSLRRSRQKARSALNEIRGRLPRTVTLYEQRGRQVKDYKERILPLSQRSLELVRKQQRLGKLSQIDVLDAQRTVYRVKRSYLGLLRNFAETCVDIELLSGEPLTNFVAE